MAPTEKTIHASRAITKIKINISWHQEGILCHRTLEKSNRAVVELKTETETVAIQ